MKPRFSTIYHTFAKKLKGTIISENKYVKTLHSRVSSGLGPCWTEYDGAEIYINPNDAAGGSIYNTGEYHQEIKN